MNEFTKEELQQYLDYIETDMSTHRMADNECMYKLRNKVQSMIDNYCEHNLVIPNFGEVRKCTHCNQFVDGITLTERDGIIINKESFPNGVYNPSRGWE